MNPNTQAQPQFLISLIRLPPEAEKSTRRYAEVRRMLGSFGASEIYSVILPGKRPDKIEKYSDTPPKTTRHHISEEPDMFATLDDFTHDGMDEESLNELVGVLYAWLCAREPLRRTLAIWGLTQSEAASLFGVSRQALSKWLATGIPAKRVESVADLAAATDVLIHYLKQDRIPAVVRRPIPEKANNSLLDLLGKGKTKEILETCRDMFDFQAVSC